MAVVLWLVMVFLLGAAIGSFLNVCIARLPLEKSVCWPLDSRCGHCLQSIRWYDNIPLLSYWVLRGRCRTCGAPFSMGYFIVELLTGLGFGLLFYLEVVVNVHRFPILDLTHAQIVDWGVIPWEGWVVFGLHAVLFSFLMVAAGCDFNHRDIPLGVTLTGALVGLVCALILPWPWPYSPAAATPRPLQGMLEGYEWLLPGPLKSGLYPWPVWGPLPAWLQPGGNWQMGLATGLAGLLVGSLLVRFVRKVFSWGLGVEALGMGDADIMMMAGSFLGWQPVVAAFFIAVFPGLFFGIIQLIVRRENALPFGPALAIGVMTTCLGWQWIGPRMQLMFFHPLFLAVMAGFCGVFLLGSGYVLGRGRRRRSRERRE